MEGFARILYYIATFLFMLILLQVKQLLKIRYFLSWWAYSFLLAAKALSSILLFHITHRLFAKTMAQIEIVLLSGIVVILVVRTLMAVSRKSICVED